MSRVRYTKPQLHKLAIMVTDQNMAFLTHVATTFGISIAEFVRRILIDTEQQWRRKGAAGLREE